MDKRLEKIIKFKNNFLSLDYLENLYEYLKSYSFSDKEFIRVSNLTGYSIKVLKKQLLEYWTKILDYTEESFTKFIDSNKNNETCVKEQYNPALEKIGVKTKLLWTNEEEKKVVLEYIFNQWFSNNFSSKIISSLASTFRIQEYKIYDLIKEYTIVYKKMDKETVREYLVGSFVDERRTNSNLFKIYKDLSIEMNLTDLKKYFNDCNYKFSYIKNTLRTYEYLFFVDEINNIKANFKTYEEYIQLEGRKSQIKTLDEKKNINRKNNKNAATIIITKYLAEENISFSRFLNDNNISENMFTEYVSVIKEHNKELYEKYVLLRSKKEKISRNIEREQLEEVSIKIRNGIEENGEIRDFDIIDYLSITKVPLSFAYKISKNTYNEELKKFAFKHIDAEKYNRYEYDALKTEKRIVGFKLDSKGRIIEGSGREITDKEKEELIEYLNENDIPINKHTYNAALRRYLNNFIKFDQKNTLKLTNKK